MRLNRKHIMVLVAVMVLAVASASVAFAEEPATGQDPETAPFCGGWLARGWLGKGWLGKAATGKGGFILGFIKGKTDVDLKTLLDELKDGKTLDEIASEYGLDLAALRDEIAANTPKALFEGLDKEAAAILSYVSKKAGVDVETLVEEYKNGTSLEDIAAANGLDLVTIKQEIATCLAAVKGSRNAWGVLCYIAGRANVDLKTLVEEYQNGKSLEDIAAEYGLDLSAIQTGIDSAKSAIKPGGMNKGLGFGIRFGLRIGRHRANGQNGQGDATQETQPTTAGGL